MILLSMYIAMVLNSRPVEDSCVSEVKFVDTTDASGTMPIFLRQDDLGGEFMCQQGTRRWATNLQRYYAPMRFAYHKVGAD